MAAEPRQFRLFTGRLKEALQRSIRAKPALVSAAFIVPIQGSDLIVFPRLFVTIGDGEGVGRRLPRDVDGH